MKNKIPLIVIGILLLSSLSTIGLTQEADTQTMTFERTFSKVNIETSKINNMDFNTVSTSDSLAVLHHAGQPLLPRSVETIELPFGTSIEDVTYEITNVETVTLTKKILPCPQPVIIGIETEAEYIMDKTTYQSNDFYPNDWVRISTGGGINSDNKPTTFCTIETFPVRYNPVEDTIQQISEITIDINYNQPKQPLVTAADEFDMVVIAPNSFSSDLQRLIDHKNDVDVSTYLKTTEEIYSEYDGVDKPEQIKYFIKDAFDNEGIKYVLLVGGMKSPIFGTPRDDPNQGTKDWHLPVRYTNLVDGGGGGTDPIYDPGFISDLYYADLYDSEGNFSSWDPNGDGIFAKWSGLISQKDKLDLYPDLYVGRLACRNNMEVKFMVDKIITYETETAGSAWFNNMIGVGGDSHDDPSTNLVEGEVVCNHVFERYMEEFTPVKLYASFKESDPDHVPSDENILREVSNGAGFLLFDGHGSPGSWNTHWPGEFNWQDTPGGISVYDFFSFDNVGKYPICIIGGCHNSQFNITLLSTLLNKPFTWSHGVPYAECFGWHIARKNEGGAIASMGNTGLGYGTVGNSGDVDGDGEDLPDTVEALGGYQEVMFFKSYNDGIDVLGETWGGAQREFLNTYPAEYDRIDAKTVEQWPLLGDPSLKIGGYS
ncbi:MAG TPA: C25 family cysteine peptidase [Candidatus Thermoplasmatota archaeon]|nr:C25 family cysteine peptidase [Candidatus Thermoplasmatota archaeon]